MSQHSHPFPKRKVPDKQTTQFSKTRWGRKVLDKLFLQFPHVH